MSDEQSMVYAFHRKFGLENANRPRTYVAVGREFSTALTRISLIYEEVGELIHAIRSCDNILTADALADVLYTVYGCAVELGIDVAPVFAEVHRSNMTKEKGDGWKIKKGESFSPANIEQIIRTQLGANDLPF